MIHMTPQQGDVCRRLPLPLTYIKDLTKPMKKLLVIAGILLAATSAHAMGSKKAAQPIKETVNVWVGFGVGGGYDTAARTFAKHLPKHLPGNPTVVVRNKPGAGSAKLLNSLYTNSPTTGYDIAFFHPGAMQIAIYGKRKVNFKPEGFQYIGNMYTDVNSCVVWKGAGQNIKTFADLKNSKSTVFFGAGSPVSVMSSYPLFLKNALGANLKVIYGYRGTRQTVKAMASKELQGSCGLFESSILGSYKNYWDDGDMNPFIQLDVKKKTNFFGPDATLLSSLLPTDKLKQASQFVFGIDILTRPILAPPKLPKANVAILRKAFTDTMNDPELKAEIKKRFLIDADPLDGEAVQQFIVDMINTPQSIVDEAWKLTQPPKRK